jgi:hypothetical protein
MPVVTLGFGAALTHLLGAPADVPEVHPQSAPVPVPDVHLQVHPESAPGVHPEGAPRPLLVSAPGERTRSAPPTAADAREHFREELARGEVPSQRRIKDELGGGWDRVRQIHESLMNEPRDDLTAELASLQAGASAPDRVF